MVRVGSGSVNMPGNEVEHYWSGVASETEEKFMNNVSVLFDYRMGYEHKVMDFGSRQLDV